MKKIANPDKLLSEQISKRIKELRKIRTLTQEQVAEKAGLGVSAFSRIERGVNSNIQVNTLQRIIEALDVEYSTFFSFSNNEEPLDELMIKFSQLDDYTLDIFKRLLDRL